MISRSTIAAAARVIEFAAARPMARSARLIPPSKNAAQEEGEAGNAQEGRGNFPVFPQPHP
jgi:hypothetical protein